MKRIFSALVALVILLSVVSCAPKKDSGSSGKSEPEGNVEMNVIKDYECYFELITTTHYEVIRENVNAKRQEHGEYVIIKSYDEYLAFLPSDKTAEINEELFLDNYILAIKLVEESDLILNLKKYKKDDGLFVDKILREKIVMTPGVYNVPAVVPDVVSKFVHLKIPKHIVTDEVDREGKLTIEKSGMNTYEYRTIDLSSYPNIELKENEARFLSEEEEFSWIDSDKTAFVFNYEKEIVGFCEFEDFHVEDGTVYVTLNRFLPYRGNSFGTEGNETEYCYGGTYYDNGDTYVVSIDDSMLPYDMPQNPSFNITVIEYYR